MRELENRSGLLDHVLTGLMAMVALYASAKSVTADGTATIYVGLVAIGTIFSWIATTALRRSPILKLDGFLYAGLAVLAIYMQPRLNLAMPEALFTDQLTFPGMISWLVVFGSFVAWRDGTMIFQAVPCIALFGLVGVYNSYSNAILLFFGLLICMTTLFSRIHRRSMVSIAKESGFTRMDTLNQDAWRWMAGPEWALASAVGVGFVSMVGAPLIQSTVHTVLGTVPLSVGRPWQSNRRQNPLGSDEGVSTRIGTGPRSISGRPIFLAQLDEPRYLRSGIYEAYTGRGWISAARSLNGVRQASGAITPGQAAAAKISSPKRIDFSVTPVGYFGGAFPTPGEVVALDTDRLIALEDGTFQAKTGGGNDLGTVSGSSEVPMDETAAKYSRPNPPADSNDDLSVASPRVVSEIAHSVADNVPNPYDKAWAIKREIERRCMYDLNAPATPSDSEPVAYFLTRSHVGYCDLFASSMVLMARAVGLRARYVTGFYPVTNEKDSAARYILRDSDAHAWAELYFQGVGWIPFDATENAASVAGGERGGTTIHDTWYGAWWVIPTVIGIPLLIGIGATLLKYKKGARARDPRVVYRSRLGRTYQLFAAALSRASRVPRKASMTLDQYFAATSGALGPHLATAAELNERFVSALYSPQEMDEAALANLHTDVSAFSRATRGVKPPRTLPVAEPQESPA